MRKINFIMFAGSLFIQLPFPSTFRCISLNLSFSLFLYRKISLRDVSSWAYHIVMQNKKKMPCSVCDLSPKTITWDNGQQFVSLPISFSLSFGRVASENTESSLHLIACSNNLIKMFYCISLGNIHSNMLLDCRKSWMSFYCATDLKHRFRSFQLNYRFSFEELKLFSSLNQ